MKAQDTVVANIAMQAFGAFILTLGWVADSLLWMLVLMSLGVAIAFSPCVKKNVSGQASLYYGLVATGMIMGASLILNATATH